MKIAEHEELKEWQDKHGVTLQLGLMVKLTDEGVDRFETQIPIDGQFMIVGVKMSMGGITVSLNAYGETDDYVPMHGRIRLEHIEPVPGDL